MENIKTYAPYILIAIVALYAIRKFSAQKFPQSIRSVIPLTPAGQTYTDPNAPFRAGAFERLAGVAQSQIEGETARSAQQFDLAKSTQAQQLGFAQLDLQKTLGLTGFSVQRDLGFAGIGAQRELGLAGLEVQSTLGRLREETLKFLQGEQFRQEQFFQQARERELQIVAAERENDRRFQQAAIDRAFSLEERRVSGQRQTNILNSIFGTATKILGGIFGF